MSFFHDLSDKNYDAFDRLRVSEPVTIFDSQLQYGTEPLFWETFTSGVGGSTTHLPNESSLSLTLTGADIGRTLRQTYRYFRYQPGKSLAIIMTGNMGNQIGNVKKRIGYFDDNDGVFFEQDGTNGMSVAQRSSVSGSTSDTVAPAQTILQANWNIDKMDGTGPSGQTLDATKTQIFIIDLQWLGAGRVRYGLVMNGNTFYVHQINNANLYTTTYMKTANLPLRYEIVSSAASSNADMKQICSTVISEGGFEYARGITFAASNGITSKAVTTRRPILSIRPRTTFNGLTNRIGIFPLTYSVLTDANAFVEIVLNGTLSSGTSFSNVDASNSAVEFDVGSAAIAGGLVIDQIQAGSSFKGSNNLSESIQGLLQLSLNQAGSAQDVLSVVATSYSGTANTAGVINWREMGGIS